MSLPPPESNQSIALAWLSLDSRAASVRPTMAARVLVLNPVNSHGNAAGPRYRADCQAAFHAPRSVSPPT
jgi:hypothetical protein